MFKFLSCASVYVLKGIGYLVPKLPGCGKITLYICEHKSLRKVDIFVIRPQDAEWFHLGVHNRENKPLKFIHKIIRSVFSAFRIAAMKQETFCWLYQSQVNHSNLHNFNTVVPLMETLKQNRPFLLIFRRWYYILKNIKSIRQLVMFKITNVNVGHLYKFPTYVTQDWTNLWQYKSIMRFVLLW